MDTLVKADIFFFISSVATVILTILLSILLFYLIRAGRILYEMSLRLQDHFKESQEFVSELKERLESNLIFRIFFPAVKMTAFKERARSKRKR